MKSSREHRVPLSDAALDVLKHAGELTDGRYIFPSVRDRNKPLSDMTLTKVLRSTGLAERGTVHGFRSSFRTWSIEETDAPWAVCEAALAHNVGDDVVRSYARSDLFRRRRALMQQWADYLTIAQIARSAAV